LSISIASRCELGGVEDTDRSVDFQSISISRRSDVSLRSSRFEYTIVATRPADDDDDADAAAADADAAAADADAAAADDDAWGYSSAS